MTLNYYNSEYEARLGVAHPKENELIKEADEILTLYFSGTESGKLESLKKSNQFKNDFFDFLELAKLQGNDAYKANPEWVKIKSILTAPEFKYIDQSNVFTIEASLAKHRFDRLEKNFVSFEEYDFLHNLLFISFMLEFMGVKENKAIKALKKEIYTRPFFFNRDEIVKYKDERASFLRNAYRAEEYAYKHKDWYTPLILTRMALEQYAKYTIKMYSVTGEIPKEENELGVLKSFDFNRMCIELAKLKPDEGKEHLTKYPLISMPLKIQLDAARGRGNQNTHYGEFDYPFAVIHGIMLLKKCYNEMIK